MRAQLEDQGFTLSGPDMFVSDIGEVVKVCQELFKNSPDLLLVLQATFSDSTMVLHLAQNIDAPILLWAFPEARTGDRLRLNSLCGINLAAHALKREGYGYDYVYAAPDDPIALERVHIVARAGRVKRLLRQARIGRVGEHPEGFDSCKFSQDALKSRFGLEIVQVNLERVFQGVREADPKNIEALLEQLRKRLDGLDELDQTAVRGTLGTYLALRQISDDEHLDGLGVRCWPEFFTELGCAACGAMSMLSDELTPCSCETDVNGTISQLVLQWLSGGPAFGSDLVSIDVDEDIAVLWHCGLAPLSMADTTVRPRGTIHSNRNLPLLMEFPLKPGKVTVARLSESNGSYRLGIGSGEILRAPLSFSGTSGALRFDRPVSEVLDTILKEGMEHHISMTYGSHVPALRALANMLDLPLVRL
jgi:L-fucose isomerase-like protein